MHDDHDDDQHARLVQRAQVVRATLLDLRADRDRWRARAIHLEARARRLSEEVATLRRELDERE